MRFPRLRRKEYIEGAISKTSAQRIYRRPRRTFKEYWIYPFRSSYSSLMRMKWENAIKKWVSSFIAFSCNSSWTFIHRFRDSSYDKRKSRRRQMPLLLRFDWFPFVLRRSRSWSYWSEERGLAERAERTTDPPTERTKTERERDASDSEYWISQLAKKRSGLHSKERDSKT